MVTKITCVVNDVALSEIDLRREHGLAFWIETGQGNILFDTGQTAEVLSHNLAVLDLRPQDAGSLALSHAHYDHTGGLEAILSKNLDLTIYAHIDIFQPRYSLQKGKYQSIGISLTHESLTKQAQLHLSNAPSEIFHGLWTTGEISERPEPEGRSAQHFIRTNKGWQPDSYRDDLSLVIKTSAGLVLICGCCHAGLLNTLFHVQQKFEGSIIAVLGGTHLMTANDLYLNHVIEIITDRFPYLNFYLNHCTGEQAYQTLTRAFGSRIKSCPAGTVVTFDS